VVLNLPLITKFDLEEAKDWGDGWCLACGAKQASLEDGHATHECGECGEKAVVAAENLAEIARRVPG
jgi:predicted RNA-binding Zn-ribbon protein involved in translation (DUF1610 family)